MPIFKRCLSCLLCITLLLAALALPMSAEGKAPPSVSAASALLMEASRGNVIYEKDADRRMSPASTTKIMTALVALELLPADTVITVPPEAVGVEGSSIYLTEGERLTLEQLLYALLLESANDAAVAVAVAAGGSVAAFADAMNRKAGELGLCNTQFQNPHGLDAEGHYTTARELAEIARHALQNELIRQIVSTRKTTIPHAGNDGVRLLVNHNKLLRSYEGAIGVKTGYTKRSGRTLVSAAEREGVRLIAVTLQAPDDWRDHTAMLDYGFSLWEAKELCRENSVCLPLPVVGGEIGSAVVGNTESLTVTLPREHPPVTQVLELPRFLYAPVAAGEAVGAAVFRCDLDGDGSPEELGRLPLRVQCEVKKPQRLTLWQRLLRFFGIEK